MIVAGKCPPETEELRETYEKGFDYTELYLEKNHLEDLEDTVETVRDADIEVVSIHTPHVHPDQDTEYFLKAGELADKLDAYLVFHSKYFHHTHITQLEELDIKSEYGYENNPGISKTHLEEMILKKDHELVIDTAHYFMATPENYLDEIRQLLNRYSDRINLIHLCDSKTTEDGLAFGDGEMDMKKVSDMIYENFDGILVLEVMPEHQEDAREKLQKYLR